MEQLSNLRYVRPATVAEALAARAGTPEGRFVAGGTDLVANLRRGLSAPPALIDLSGIAELRSIDRTPEGGLRIGAAATLAELIDAVGEDWPAIAKAAESIAGPTHRAMATVGGNLCLDTRCIHYNQSDWWRRGQNYCLKYRGDRCHVVEKSDRCYAAYSGDLAPILMVLGAEVEIARAGGAVRRPLADLFNEDGRRHLTLAAGELVTAVHVPPQGGVRAGYEKVRGRDSIDFAMVGVAAALSIEGGRIAALRVAVTGTNSKPVLVTGLDDLVGRPLDDEGLSAAEGLMRKQIAPLRTSVTAPAYRRRVAIAVLRRLLLRLSEAG